MELVVVLAFTGVPTRQLRPERMTSGRWDELYRTLLAVKQWQSAGPVHAVVLLEESESLVAAVLVGPERLAVLEAGAEGAFQGTLGPAWMREGAVVRGDVCDALLTCLRTCRALDATDTRRRSSLQVLSSPDDDSGLADRARGWASAVDERAGHGRVVRVMGSPCNWALAVERERMPRIVVALEGWLGARAVLVHAGGARLRCSQAVMCGLALEERERSGAGRIPRTCFRVWLGRVASRRRAAELAHHFLVEVLFLERRRDTPRHHVVLEWEDLEERGERCVSSVSSLQVEHVRGDPEAKARRRAALGTRETGASSEALVPEWLRLMALPAEPPNRSIRGAPVLLDCSTVPLLEAATARTVAWQLGFL